ncbi:MAG TPA: type II secretion system F family protein, partial [Candidatus Paceibacterota bacterium]|nr:type II secretion system F family protein [Candidatus Paceibacterota bacterium]
LFHYTAVEASGNVTQADLEADAVSDVLRHLAEKGLQPISVKPVKQRVKGLGLFQGINTSDKVFLTKYLALMLRVGTDLLSAINILIADFDKPAVRDLLLEVRENLSKGKPFYEAFAAHPRSFSPTFVNLVKAAEKSGNLQRTFEDLSNSLESEAELRSRIKSAMIYPIILLCAASAIIIFLTTFALPKVASVFSSSGVTPPLFSRVVFGIGLFVGANIWAIALAVIAVAGTCVWGVQKTETGRRMFDRTLTSLPLIRGITHDLAIQRMASTMSSLMKAGLPITETITVAAETVGIREYKFALLRIANEGLAKGLTIGEAFRRETVFPKSVTSLVAISEKAGHLEEVLSTLAQFYGANVDGEIKAVVSLLEPLLLLTMGVMVAVIALSIIVPLYQLTTQF